jgi:hypothetical protein
MPNTAHNAHACSGGRAQGQAPASEGTTGRGAVLTALPPYGMLSDLVRGCLGKTRAQDGSVDVLTVRAVDMALMKDTLRCEGARLLPARGCGGDGGVQTQGSEAA